jgi:DNA-binding transcriptional LysR family regulator
MLPDLLDLRCVDALARAGRFHEAARQVALSPSAFGRRVRRAEEVLGVELFARTTRTVRLTEDGQAQLPRIRALLAAAETLTAPAEGPAPVSLTLGTRHELGLSWLMPARRMLRQALPHLTVHLRFGAADRLMEEVARQRVDAAVLSQRPARSEVMAEVLHPEHYLTVASPARLQQVPLRGPDDASDHVLVDIDPTQPLWSYVARRHGELRWASMACLGTIAAVRQAVIDGEGVATLPAYFVHDDVAEGRLVEVLADRPADPDAFRLLFRHDHPHEGLLVQVAALLRARPLV